MAEKTEKKPSSIQRLFEFAGNYKYLAVASWILAAISAFVALVPFYFIWRLIKEVLRVAPDYAKTQLMAADCSLEPVDSRKTSGDRKKATFSRLYWSFLFYFL